MRIHRKFVRQKGAVSSDPAIGSDADPNTAGPGSTPLQPSPNTDNVMSIASQDSSGWPVHRIAIFYSTTAVAPIPMNCQVWQYDTRTGRWYLTEPQKTIAVDGVTYFDVVAIMSTPPKAGDLSEGGSGGIDVYVRVTDPGAAPNGVYTFGIAGDMSTF